MENPKTLATLGTQDEDKQSKIYNTENYKDEKHGPPPNNLISIYLNSNIGNNLGRLTETIIPRQSTNVATYVLLLLHLPDTKQLQQAQRYPMRIENG